MRIIRRSWVGSGTLIRRRGKPLLHMDFLDSNYLCGNVEDMNHDGYYDDDSNYDGFHDDDMNFDSFHDDDMNRDGFHDGNHMGEGVGPR